MNLLNVLFLMAPGAEGENQMPMNLLFFGAIIFVFYFFMIRPQTKKAKEQRNFISSIQKGSKVVTTGGIFGTIVKMDENFVVIESEGGTKIKILKSAISLDNSKPFNK